MPSTLRIATWNLWYPDIDRRRRIQAAAAALTPYAPHVVCVQEAWQAGIAELAEALGMQVAVAAHPAAGTPMTNAILTSLPLVPANATEVIALDAVTAESGHRGAVAARVISPNGRTWRIVSTHLAWGSGSEGVRLAQARQLEEMAAAAASRQQHLTQVLCGDLNALPESATLRYLTGLDPDPEGESTQWVDAWTAAGAGAGHTSDPKNPWAATTAAEVGILDVTRIPPRRIDYVLVRGFAHGRAGSPLRAKMLGMEGDPVPSDHYGLVVELWDPEQRGNVDHPSMIA